MRAPNYCVQGRNATAVNILRSWLNAVNIPNKPSGVPGFDLTVAGVNGEVEVQVCLRPDETMTGEGIQVLAGEVTGKKSAKALAAFHKITDAAGYPRQKPVDRGVEPELNEQGNPRKLHYKDEEVLVAIRHNEFRRAPNPPKNRWEQYRLTMEKTSWAFLRLNFELCARHGLGIDDLLSYARCWTVNFCAGYETPTPVYCDNERKLYAYLRQRFAFDLRPILLKKERSMLPDAETVSLALYGRPDPSDGFPGSVRGEPLTPAQEEVEEIDYDYIARNCELDTSSPKARRESAAKKLGELLSALSHDRMVEVLKETAASTFFDFVTRKEASRQLRLHATSCGSCDLGRGPQEDEELAGDDAPSVEE